MDSSQVMQKSILSNYIARIKAERDRDIEKAKFEFIYEEFKVSKIVILFSLNLYNLV